MYDAPMKLYALYLLRQLTLPALLATLAFSGAVWLSQSLRFVDLIVNKGLPVTTFLHLTLLLFPSLLLVILPFALFCAVLFAYHRLILESELTVMKAVGLSNLQIAAPCLVLAGIVTGIGYALGLYVMPLTYQGFRDLQYEVRRDFSDVLLQPGVFNTPIEDVTVFVRDQEEDGSLSGILVHDDRTKRLPVTMMAESGLLVQGASGPLFVLERGSRQELDARAPRERRVSILRFDRYTLDLVSAASQPDDRGRKPKELYLHELLSPQQGLNEPIRRELIAEGHKRLTSPLIALVFALIGLACLLPREYSRHGPWRNILIAAAGAAAVQAASVAAGSLAARSLALIPLMYAAPLVPAGICLAMLLGDRPRRGAPASEPAPA
jgi:lipopolysaccharide export system permease protein